MASEKEIRTKIKSVKSTQKITRAMEMVAASKMKRLQQRMHASLPYAEKIQNVINHVAKSNPEYKHPFMEVRAVKRAGIIVVSTDRGLCGGLNINLFRKAVGLMKDLQQKGTEIDLGVFGTKGKAFFKRYNAKIIAAKDHFGEQPAIRDIIGVIKVMLNAFINKEIDSLYLVSNKFVSTMSQVPEVQQLLPIKPEEPDNVTWDYIYEPDAKEILNSLLERFIESQVYQGVVNNIACEQAARMVAMKSASDNADQLINDFQLAYNKARQASITQELSEIVAGAAAV